MFSPISNILFFPLPAQEKEEYIARCVWYETWSCPHGETRPGQTADQKVEGFEEAQDGEKRQRQSEHQVHEIEKSV